MGRQHPDDYMLPSTEDESLRLQLQGARLYGGTSFLDGALARGPRKVLDVGCGTGYFARHVAACLPNAFVV